MPSHYPRASPLLSAHGDKAHQHHRLCQLAPVSLPAAHQVLSSWCQWQQSLETGATPESPPYQIWLQLHLYPNKRYGLLGGDDPVFSSDSLGRVACSVHTRLRIDMHSTRRTSLFPRDLPPMAPSGEGERSVKAANNQVGLNGPTFLSRRLVPLVARGEPSQGPRLASPRSDCHIVESSL